MARYIRGQLEEDQMMEPFEDPMMTIYHYSNKLGDDDMVTIDPEAFITGGNAYSRGEREVSSVPRSFFYPDPTQREQFFRGSPPLYTAQVPRDQIYDLVEDPEGYIAKHKHPTYGLRKGMEWDNLLNDLKENYLGVIYGRPDLRMVSLLHPVDAERHKGEDFPMGKQGQWFHDQEQADSRKYTPPSERMMEPKHMKPGYKPREKEPRRRFNIKQLVEMAHSKEDWKDWYSASDEILEQLFGKDADMLKSLLAVTSARTSVPNNVTKAIKAYTKILQGMPIDSSVGIMPAHAQNINRILHGEPISGGKVGPFEQNLFGILAPTTIDLHMAEILYGKYDRSKGKYRPIDQTDAVRYYSQNLLEKVAKRLDWEPAEVQAALWSFNIELRGEDPVSYDTILQQRAQNAWEESGGTYGSVEEQVDALWHETGGPFTERGSGEVDPESTFVQGEKPYEGEGFLGGDAGRDEEESAPEDVMELFMQDDYRMEDDELY